MKQSKLERVIAEWQNEKIIVEVCAGLIDGIVDGAGCQKALAARAGMLNEMIGRASTIDEGQQERAPKPTRTRKGKAGLPKPEPTMGQNQKPQS